MSAISKHNQKSWSDSQRYVNHIYDEKFYLEILHDNKQNSQGIWYGNKNAVVKSNTIVSKWKDWSEYHSGDGNDYILEYEITAPVTGEYGLEILYRTEEEGEYGIQYIVDGLTSDCYIWGSPEFISRYSKTYNLQKGKHTFRMILPKTVYWDGNYIKHIVRYIADESLTKGHDLTVTKLTQSTSKIIGADELSAVVLYDNDYKDPTSLTNFIFDYRDDVNCKFINTNGELEQTFGGYVSNCKLNNNETELTINCAGRLIDGDKRYIVEEINIGGTASDLTEKYPDEYIRRFDDYNQACEYLFNNYETRIQSNIREVIEADKYEKISIDITQPENFNRLVATNMIISNEALGVYVRNETGDNNTQTLMIYDSSWFDSKPVLLDDYPIFFMEYGMGEPKIESSGDGSSSNSNEDTVSTGEVLTGRWKPTCGCCRGTKYIWYQKSWKNYCPNCGKSGTLTDNPKGVVDGEITCSMSKGGCDADYCGYCGGDKWGGGKCKKKKLTPASTTDTSSNSGNTSSSTTSKKNVIQEITDEAFNYNYKLGSCSSLACLLRGGSGDCWAFSELIYTRLKEQGINCKVVQYSTSASSRHRSVLVQNESGDWVDFPYREYGWGTRYNNYLNNTSKSTSASSVMEYTAGVGVNISTGVTTGSNKVTTGFDKDKQCKFWISLEYSTSDDSDAQRHTAYIDFTAGQSDEYMTWSGLTPISLNNIIDVSSVSVINKMLQLEDIPHVYMHKLYLQYDTGTEQLWENTENSVDNSSYKIVIREIGFRNGTLLNPVDIDSTGKTINSILEKVVESGELNVKFYPHEHRNEDMIVVSKDKSITPTFTVYEGDTGNILSISDWNFTPASDFHDNSLVVFKNKAGIDADSLYNYTNTRNPLDVLRYGELSNVTSVSDDISHQEAYYRAKDELKDSNSVGSSMSVTVVGCPADLHIGDYVECVFEDNHYNDIKQVKSIVREWDMKQSPRIQTKIGLNKVSPELDLKQTFEKQRKTAKESTALFSRTAIYDTDEIFKWEE